MSIKKKIKHSLEVLISIVKEKNIVPILVEKEKEEILKGRIALIIGGAGGIGLAITKKFLECGCKVVISGTNASKMSKVCEELSDVRYIIMDLKDISSIESKIQEAETIFGKIDTFVCASGVHTNRNGFAWNNVTEEDYDFVMDINLKGTYFLIQKIAKYMVDSNIIGNILVISSQSALEPSWSPYRLSKLGISGMVEGFAQQLIKHNIVVNAIGPGSTFTKMQRTAIEGSIYTPDSPIERMAMPEEIADFAQRLVFGAGDLVVGQTVYLSAGRGIIDVR